MFQIYPLNWCKEKAVEYACFPGYMDEVHEDDVGICGITYTNPSKKLSQRYSVTVEE